MGNWDAGGVGLCNRYYSGYEAWRVPQIFSLLIYYCIFAYTWVFVDLAILGQLPSHGAETQLKLFRYTYGIIYVNFVFLLKLVKSDLFRPFQLYSGIKQYRLVPTF